MGIMKVFVCVYTYARERYITPPLLSLFAEAPELLFLKESSSRPLYLHPKGKYIQ